MTALVRCPQCGRETPAAGSPGMAPRCRHCMATLYGAKPVGPAANPEKAKIKLVGGLVAGVVVLVGGCLGFGVLSAVALLLCSGVAGPVDVGAVIPGAGSAFGEGESKEPVTVDAPVPELPPQKQSLGDMPDAGEFDPATEVVPYEEPTEYAGYLPQPDWNVVPDPYEGEIPTLTEAKIDTKTPVLPASLHGPFVVADLPERPYYWPNAGLIEEAKTSPPSRLVDLRTGETVGTFPPQAPTWNNGRLGPDGKYLVGPDTTAPEPLATRNEGKLFVWEPDKTEPTRTLEMTGMLFWMDFVAPDKIATASVDEELARVPRVDAPDQMATIALSRTSHFRVWDLTTGKTVLDATLPEDDLAFRRVERWDAFEEHVGLHPDGVTHVKGEYPQETEGIVALAKGEQPPKLAYQVRRGYGAVSPGREYAVLLGRHHLTFVSIADGKVLGRAPLDPNRAREDGRGLSFSPDGKLLYGAVDRVGRGKEGKISGGGGGSFVCLMTWSMVDGRRLSDPKLVHEGLAGRAIASPIPGTVLMSQVDPTIHPNIPPDGIEHLHDGQIRDQFGNISAGGLIDVSGGGVVDHFPYVTLDWLSPQHALVYQHSFLNVVRLDPLAIETAANRPTPEYGPIQNDWIVPRPPIVEADRSAVRTVALPASAPDWKVPAASARKPFPPVPKMRAWPDAFADEQFAVVAYEAKPRTLPNNPQQAQYVKVTEVARPVWHRFDSATGEAIGEPIELWPWGTPDHVRQKAPTSLAAMTPSADKLAYVDPRDGARVDVWDAEGNRLVGFHPFGEYDRLEWIGWAGDKLWTLRRGKLVAWEMPACKAVCEIDGGYRAPIHLPPGRTFLVAETRKLVDFIDAATGEIVGRCEDPKHDDYRMTALSPDGKKLLRVRLIPQPRTYPNGEGHVWDLTTGAEEKSVIIGAGTNAVFELVPGYDNRYASSGGDLLGVGWLGERTILGISAYCWLVELDVQGPTILYQSPFYGEPPSTAYLRMEHPLTHNVSIDPYGRLWCKRMIDPAAGDVVTNWEWRSLEAPNQNVPTEAEVVAPDREIVLNRSSTVKVNVDLDGETRSRQLAERIAGLLQQEGYTIGPGGWNVDVSYRVVDGGFKFDTGNVIVPSVEVIWKLTAPDGATVKEYTVNHGWSPGISKYYTGTEEDIVGGSVIQTDSYNFGLEDPRTAMAEEILNYEETVDLRALSHELPRSVLKTNGRLMPLPIESAFTAP